MAYRAGQCGDCSKSDEGTAVGYSCGIPLLRGAAGHCGSIKTGQKTDAKKQEIGRYVEQDPGKCFWKNGPVCFKRRKNKPGRGTSFSCAPAYMGFFKNTALPAEHETDMFVPVLSQTEQVSFIKIVERTKEIRKRLHKIQQLEIRYFKSMLSLAFTAGLTEGFRKQEDLSDPEPALFRESYGIGNVLKCQPANRRHYRLAEPYSTGIAVSFYHAV